MPKPLRLLLIESSPDDERLLLDAIAEAGYEASKQTIGDWAATRAELRVS